MVDWYPWGEQAIQKAKTENKPIFLSIGYSTCHWCHVMEHESFENEETAKFMNEHFVNIKVDREENPAVDKLYMTYVQLLTGRGGWPLSVFLTPELEPFFGGTYFPPGDQYGSPGFRTLLARISEIWEAAPDKLREDAQGTMAQMKNYFESKVAGDGNDLDPATLIKTAFEHFNSSFDAEYGGFTPAPKFPTPVQLGFLFDYYGYFAKDPVHGDNAKQALDMALFTLNKIAMGGIHDHVGSGFHRYSTDKFWHVPHFEKMLYDQAQLLSAYVTAYKISRDDGYANVARDIIQYVARDLQHPAGGFYSAEDADSYPEEDPSKKMEGAFYVWEDEKLDEILDPKEAKVFKRYYGVTKNGNVNPALDPQGELEDQNVLAEEMPVADVAKEFNLAVDEAEELLKLAKEKLWNYREEKRAKPHCDDKILTSWNGLMISGLALAAQTFKDKPTLDLAIKAADFIHKELYDSQAHVLRRSYRDGPSNIAGCLDDYSYLIQGLLHLYEATFDEKWVQWAYDLQQKQNELFYDKEKGGFYNISQDDKSIPIRIKDEQDGAEPSANSVTLGNLVRLGTLLEQEEYVTMARKTVGSFSTSFSRFPYAMPALLGSFMLMVNGIKQIVLTGHDEKELEPFIRVVSENFMPNKLVACAKKDGIIAEKNPIIAQLSLEPTTQAYVCENFSCGLPIQSADQLQKKIVDKQ
ncbi:hypothetical protein LRAMOSA04860 [Lichtheimia ramosa]|uniref:Spermatogenesis-associated protein 20-like TRX domain-containing protein n=1 Tax=Lichtheimia ramosa TaxID=688394 RepID=A0A077WZM4_9FUNG|nr:hypothetical protein LRAMOSA04860 [Lichtheimia ramosa]